MLLEGEAGLSLVVGKLDRFVGRSFAQPGYSLSMESPFEEVVLGALASRGRSRKEDRRTVRGL